MKHKKELKLHKLNLITARDVMGLKRVSWSELCTDGVFAVRAGAIYISDDEGYATSWSPTTDKAQALMVMEKCGEERRVSLEQNQDTKQWICACGWMVEARTSPMAICLLAAKMFPKP